MAVLKVDPEGGTPDSEIDFELSYLRGLSTAERFEMMFRKSREMAEQLLRHGHRGPAQVVKRS